MRKLLVLWAIVISSFVFISVGQTRSKIQTIRYAINLNWCGHVKKTCIVGQQAFNVAACETGNTFNIWARNGQYLGLWQMGSSERRRFGHGNNPWDQAKAAHKYWKISGWRPWPYCGRNYY